MEWKVFHVKRKKLLQRHFIDTIGKVKDWLGIHTPVQFVIISDFAPFEGNFLF